MKMKSRGRLQPKPKPVAPKTLRPARSKPAKTLYDHLKPFIGMVKDGPRDLARNHKLYASGAKKWK
jgi:hypothetical protein